MCGLWYLLSPKKNFTSHDFNVLRKNATSNLSKAHETRDSLSSSCSQIVLVYLQPFGCHSPLNCTAAENRKKHQTRYFFGGGGVEGWGSTSFKVIDVNTAKKLVTSASHDMQHTYTYLQLFLIHARHDIRPIDQLPVPLFRKVPLLTLACTSLLEPTWTARGLLKSAKKNSLTTFFGKFKVVQGHRCLQIQSLSPVLVMICSMFHDMFVPICNRFHATRNNCGKITTF